jgi:dTDP-4-amino-4,6-dideoxygalactose transaminase
LVKRYQENLADIPGIRFQLIPKVNVSSYKDLSVVIDRTKCGFSRDQLIEYLAEEGIETRIYFGPAVHQQDAFRRYLKRGQKLPVTEFLAANIVSLPLYSHQRVSEVDFVCEQIHECWRKYGA